MSIVKSFGSFDKFITYFSEKTAALQGSGWGWLAFNKITGLLEYHQTENQDRLCDKGAHLVPLLTIDVWEHAYYLNYQNRRPDYINAFFNVINWEKVTSLYNEVK